MKPKNPSSKERLKRALASRNVNKAFDKAKQSGSKSYEKSLNSEKKRATAMLDKRYKSYSDLKPNENYYKHEAAVKSNVTNKMVAEQSRVYDPKLSGGTKKMMKQTKQNIRRNSASPQAKRSAYKSL